MGQEPVFFLVPTRALNPKAGARACPRPWGRCCCGGAPCPGHIRKPQGKTHGTKDGPLSIERFRLPVDSNSAVRTTGNLLYGSKDHDIRFPWVNSVAFAGAPNVAFDPLADLVPDAQRAMCRRAVARRAGASCCHFIPARLRARNWLRLPRPVAVPGDGPMMRGGLVPLIPRNRQVLSAGFKADAGVAISFARSGRRCKAGVVEAAARPQRARAPGLLRFPTLKRPRKSLPGELRPRPGPVPR